MAASSYSAVEPPDAGAVAARRSRQRLHALPRAHVSIRRTLGESAWARLPAAVQERFADQLQCAEYTGCFEVVRASAAGRLLALACRVFGTPVAPYTGADVPATVRVFAAPGGDGMVWERRYRFAGGRTCLVSSIKRTDERGELVEALPFGLRMPLRVFEAGGVLHFVSRGYFFAWFGVRLAVPGFLPPGETHVAHIDEGGGWFRFTMTSRHKWFGEVLHQTGRFRAAPEAS
ncbi:MAG TPA: DUF4166 domain-containing protein [Steroidobacteraceae bacterium]|nr:DUF4166 domain-containing protein [Steroidobacteraceae bacterium]